MGFVLMGGQLGGLHGVKGLSPGKRVKSAWAQPGEYEKLHGG